MRVAAAGCFSVCPRDQLAVQQHDPGVERRVESVLVEVLLELVDRRDLGDPVAGSRTVDEGAHVGELLARSARGSIAGGVGDGRDVEKGSDSGDIEDEHLRRDADAYRAAVGRPASTAVRGHVGPSVRMLAVLAPARVFAPASAP